MIELPKGNSRLTEVFKAGDAGSSRDLKGEFYVDILTGLPSLRKLNHRKRISIEKGDHRGFNTVFRKKKVFGHFKVEPDTCEELDSIKVIKLDYYVPENSFIMNRMIDRMRCIKRRKLYLGRYYLRLFGKHRFMGYFTLEKIPAADE
ncbi:MAG: hypothetical protein ACMUIG_03110 [Thermoplasmatota archaeon]